MVEAVDWDGAVYHRVSNPQFQWGVEVLGRLELRGDETVLDGGCGSGRLTALLLERLPQGKVIAVDSSESMLSAARRYLSPRFGDRISFVRAELEDLTLPQPVDCVFSTATFHWIGDHSKLFRQLYAALIPGGLLLAQCGGGANLNRLYRRAAALMGSPQFAPHFRGWKDPWNFSDAETAARRMKEAGFAEVQTSLQAMPTPFAGADEYREFIVAVVIRHHLAFLKDSSLREAFVESLVRQAATDQPPFVLDYCRLNLRGRS